MKIIEGMKRVKANHDKIKDLQEKIRLGSAHLSHETPLYPNPSEKIKEWAQSCNDLSAQNVKLLCAISRTNLLTSASIKLGDTFVTKTLAEWVWRRRQYAAIDLATWNAMTDRGLKEGHMPNTATGGEPTMIKIVRNYDPNLRDKKVAEFRSEPAEIDAALEVINAVTDLIEDSGPLIPAKQ